LLKLQYCGIDQ